MHTRAVWGICVSGRRKERGGDMGKGRKPEHECELCRTLGDVVGALEPEKYRCGPELEVEIFRGRRPREYATGSADGR